MIQVIAAFEAAGGEEDLYQRPFLTLLISVASLSSMQLNEMNLHEHRCKGM